MNWLWCLPCFEAGFWVSIFVGRRINNARAKEILINGTSNVGMPTPFIDGRLEKMVGPGSKLQIRCRDGVVFVARKLVNSKIFEHLTLMAIKARWPKGKQISEEVKLCL